MSTTCRLLRPCWLLVRNWWWVGQHSRFFAFPLQCIISLWGAFWLTLLTLPLSPERVYLWTVCIAIHYICCLLVFGYSFLYFLVTSALAHQLEVSKEVTELLQFDWNYKILSFCFGFTLCSFLTWDIWPFPLLSDLKQPTVDTKIVLTQLMDRLSNYAASSPDVCADRPISLCFSC